MATENLTENFSQQLKKVLDDYKNQLSSMRTNRANAGLVEDIQIEYYGTKAALKTLALVTVNQPNIILIQPFDPSSIDSVIKAVQLSPLGVNPAREGNLIRITLPSLTEERRIELTKFVSQREEEFRVIIKKEREGAMEKLEEAFKNKEMSEDDKFKKKETMQKAVEGANKSIEEWSENKKNEILSL